MHPLLARQLKRAGASPDAPPDAAAWRALLESVDRTYAASDQDRYTLERSLSVSSREMQQLYDDLRKSSESRLARQRDELEESLAIVRATLESAQEGILLVIGENRTLGFNRRFADMWRLPEDVGPGDRLRVIDLLLGQLANADVLERAIAVVRADPTKPTRDELHTRDGRTLDAFSAPITLSDGACAGRVWFVRDVTEDRRRDRQVIESRDAAERASRAKSEFLANMGHELRTPLNAILGFARVMDRGELAERPRRQLQHVIRAGDHMLALVNDLLDLRGLEERTARVERERLSLRPIVDEAAAMVRPLIDERGHQLAVELGVERVEADRRALVQILVNLLSNAAKYTSPGGQIAIRSGMIEGGDRVSIEVADNGDGIREEDLPRLFHYYEQLGGKHALHMKGSGIGLALTKRLVEALGGEIGVVSAPGIGSRFRFTVSGVDAAPGAI